MLLILKVDLVFGVHRYSSIPHETHDTQNAQISQKQNGCNTYVIMKTILSWLSPQWLCVKSCTWVQDVLLLLPVPMMNERMLSKPSKENNAMIFFIINFFITFNQICKTNSKIICVINSHCFLPKYLFKVFIRK